MPIIGVIPAIDAEKASRSFFREKPNPPHP